MIVPYAEKFDLETQLRENTEWKPEKAAIRLPGKTKLTSERGDDESYAFDLPPQKEEGALALRVGDAREKIIVEPVTRPELTSLNAHIRLPDYLMYESDPKIPCEAARFRLSKGPPQPSPQKLPAN